MSFHNSVRCILPHFTAETGLRDVNVCSHAAGSGRFTPHLLTRSPCSSAFLPADPPLAVSGLLTWKPSLPSWDSMALKLLSYSLVLGGPISLPGQGLCQGRAGVLFYLRVFCAHMPREQRRQPRAELQRSLDIESLGRVLGLRLTGRLLRSYRQRVVNRG